MTHHPTLAGRLLRPYAGLEAGDSIVADPILEPNVALVRLLPARYKTLLTIHRADVLEFLSGAIPADEVTALLSAHFQTLKRAESLARRRDLGMELVRP